MLPGCAPRTDGVDGDTDDDSGDCGAKVEAPGALEEVVVVLVVVAATLLAGKN